MDDVTLTVVIPALNEEAHIERAIDMVDSVLSRAGFTNEIIVVDDGSTDDTGKIAREKGVKVVRHAAPLGKGSAIKSGMAESRGRLVGFIDADLEYPAEVLPCMVSRSLSDPLLTTCVVAIRSGDERSLWERLTSRIARKMISLAFKNTVTDTQAGLKLFPGWFAREFLTQVAESGWMFDVEALFVCLKHNLTIETIPVIQRAVRPRRANSREMARQLIRFIHVIERYRQEVDEAIQLIRFSLVGLFNTLVNFSLFYILVRILPPGFNGFIASGYSLLSWTVSSVFGYFLHSRFTFRRVIPALGFYVVSIAGVVIQAGFSALAATALGTSGSVIGTALGITLGSGVSYVGYRWLARKENSGLLREKRSV